MLNKVRVHFFVAFALGFAAPLIAELVEPSANRVIVPLASLLCGALLGALSKIGKEVPRILLVVLTAIMSFMGCVVYNFLFVI